MPQDTDPGLRLLCLQGQIAATRKLLRADAAVFVEECGAFQAACSLDTLERRKSAVRGDLAECAAKRDAAVAQHRDFAARQQVQGPAAR